MKVRVITNEDGSETQVLNAETGEPIEDVYSVTFTLTSCQNGAFAEVLLISKLERADVTATANRVPWQRVELDPKKYFTV